MDEEYRASLEARVAALEGLVIELLGSLFETPLLASMADAAKDWAEGEEPVPADCPHLAAHDRDSLKHRESLVDQALHYARFDPDQREPRPPSPRGGGRGPGNAH